MCLFSCSDENVYRDPATQVNVNLWRVQDKYFATMQEAADYIIQNQWSAKSINAEPYTAYLLADVLSQKTIDVREKDDNGNLYPQQSVYSERYRGGLKIADKTISGQIRIDFNGHRYDFANSNSYFFEILSGEKVEIVNGSTVIFNEASHVPFAIDVDTDKVTIDAHLLDDRRVDNNLINVGSKGTLEVTNMSLEQDEAISGKVSVVTDGSRGGRLNITNAAIVMTEIQTRYENADGTIEAAIPESVTFTSNDQKAQINLHTGWLDIHSMSQKTDFYEYDPASSTAKVNQKAVLETFGTSGTAESGTDNAEIWGTHEVEDAIIGCIDASEGDAYTDVLHLNAYHVDAKEPTCFDGGWIEHWYCPDSECPYKYFSNAECEKKDVLAESEVLIAKLSHQMTYHAKKDPTCTEKGFEAHWTCSRTCCSGKYFVKVGDGYVQKTSTELEIAALGHDESGAWVSTDESSHWKICQRCSGTILENSHTFSEWTLVSSDPVSYQRTCTVCGRIQEQSHVEHTMEHHEYRKETCTEDGNIEYWYCNVCHKYFSDAEGNVQIDQDSVTIPHHILSDWQYDIDRHWKICPVDGTVMLGDHQWGDYYECSCEGSVKHRIADCTVCGARKNASTPDYLLYDIGIGEAKLKSIESTPCGDFYINGKLFSNGDSINVADEEVIAEFRPHLNSNTNYTPYCYLTHRGSMSSVDSGIKDTDSNYKVTFTLADKKEYGVNLQANTQGGSLSITCYVRLKK